MLPTAKNKSKLCRNLQFFFKTEKIDKLQIFFFDNLISFLHQFYIFSKILEENIAHFIKIIIKVIRNPCNLFNYICEAETV